MSASGRKSRESSNSSSTADSNSYIAGNQLPYLNNMYAQAQGVTNPGAVSQAAMDASMQNQQYITAGMQGLGALTNPQGQIDAQSASLQAGLGQLFREEINPAIESNAIAAGGFGGGRQGVAQGVATGQLAQAYTQGLGDIVARANQTALGAASQIPGMTETNYANAVNPTMAGLDPVTRLSQILGAPTILQSSQSRSKSRGSGKSGGFGFGL